MLVIVEALATIKDEFQTMRLEYLFGFPFLMHIKGLSEFRQYGAAVMIETREQEVFSICTGIDAR